MFLERGAISGVRIRASKLNDLFTRYFIDATLVASAFELLAEPSVCDLQNCLERNETSRHHEHVGVVVLLDQLADLH